jgi:hypothetical protein
MNAGEFLDLITEDAKRYVAKDPVASIKRNIHMNNIPSNIGIDKDVVEAAIVDFINYMGVIRGIDYALYTKDLRSE